MGLAERRAIVAFQSTRYPALKERLDQIAGFAVPLEIDWASLDIDDYADLYDEALEKVYFLPLIEAFTALRIDPARLAEVRGAMRRVDIRYASIAARITFEQGVLTFDHYPMSDIEDVSTRAMAVVAALS